MSWASSPWDESRGQRYGSSLSLNLLGVLMSHYRGTADTEGFSGTQPASPRCALRCYDTYVRLKGRNRGILLNRHQAYRACTQELVCYQCVMGFHLRRSAQTEPLVSLCKTIVARNGLNVKHYFCFSLAALGKVVRSRVFCWTCRIGGLQRCRK